MRSAVTLLSGGLDSGTALAMWLDQGGRVALCLTADYGQHSAAIEARTSATLAERLGVPWRRLDLAWLGECARAAGSALVSSTVELPAREASAPGDEESAAAVWVPARNLVLLAVAAAHAEAIGAQVLLAGFNREEAETFPDNSASFIRAMDGVLALGVRGGLEVVAPTQALEKKQIVAEARRLGFSRSDFWSCYRRGPQPCGCCESCVRSTLAWEGEGQD